MPPIAAPVRAPNRPPPTARWPGSYGSVQADRPIANPTANAQDEINFFIASSFSAPRLPPCQTDVTRDERVPVQEGRSESFHRKFLPPRVKRVAGTHFTSRVGMRPASEITHVYDSPRDLQMWAPGSMSIDTHGTIPHCRWM